MGLWFLAGCVGGTAWASTIEGTVTVDGTGDPITSGSVRIYDSTGSSLGFSLIGNDGTYSYGGLATGTTYFAQTRNTGYFDELWNNIPCAQGDCIITNGTPINVGSNPVTANFSLAPGGSITGAITADESGEPVTTGTVRIYNESGSSLGFSLIGNDGTYFYGGLAPGAYYAQTRNTGHFDELWDDIPCPQGDCIITNGTPINVTSGPVTANLSLTSGGAISGTVTVQATGEPATSGSVRIYDAGGSSLGFSLIGNDGTYTYSGLAAGTYFAQTRNTGYSDELWDNIPCADGDCVITNGTPINVGSIPVIANFSLASGGAITGTVTAEGSGEPITSGSVRIYDASGSSLGFSLIGNDGSYTYGGLAAGTYFAQTRNTGFFDELWDDIPCAQGDCVITNGTPIKVTSGPVTANFELSPGGSITGVVTVQETGDLVTTGSVRVYDASGSALGFALIRNDGTYRYGGLAADTYFALTRNTSHIDELWENILCPQGDCIVTSGTPINVPSTGPVQINFQLGEDNNLIFTDTFEQ